MNPSSSSGRLTTSTGQPGRIMQGMSFPERRGRWAVAVLLAVGAGLRFWFVRHPNPFLGDPTIYGNIARNLLTHHVYSFAAEPGPFPPTIIRLPGYPLFLAGCFLLFGIANFAAVLWVQVVVDLLTCLVQAALVRNLFGHRAAFVALVLGCLCPFTANYTATPLTETLTLASIAVALLSFERWQRRTRLTNVWVLGIGAALAISLLLRPEQALLSVAILPAMVLVCRQRAGADPSSWLSKRLLAPALCAALCVVLPLLPWTARNWHTFHLLQPLAPRYATDPGEPIPLGFQRWYRTWAIDFASTEEVYWNYDGTAIALSDLPSRAFDSPDQQRETAQLIADYNLTTNPTPHLDARFAAIAVERIRHNPFRYYVLLPAARLANMLLRPRTELTGIQLAWWRWRDSHAQTLFGLAYAGLNLLYMTLGFAGWHRWRRSATGTERILLWAMAAFVLLRCALLLTLDNSEPRYTLELFPILIVSASALWRSPSTSLNASSSSPS